MLTIESFFRLVPIFLAVIAAILCARRFYSDRRKHDRMVMTLSVMCSIMLILAQTSWWSSSILEGSLKGAWFTNIIWNIYDALVAITFIVLSHRPNK